MKRTESAVKRVLYSEFFFPSPLLLLGKDNVFLQQLINDRMTDSMVPSKEAESHCWATVSSGKLVHFEVIVVD